MAPSFQPGDLLIVSRRAYRERPPTRGDLVIVRDAEADGQRYLKRIVGLPSEEVRLEEGMLFIDGAPLVEPYLGGLPASPGLAAGEWQLGAQDYFVMGDSRAHSTDSREFGPVSLQQIFGKAWVRCWPLRRWWRIGGRPPDPNLLPPGEEGL